MLHFEIHRNKQSPTRRYAWAFGMRLGYWPCVRGPFVQLSFAIWVMSFWIGDLGTPDRNHPSHK